MNEKYLLAVDAGTGSVRAVLFNADGEQLACEQHEWSHAEDPRYPGSMDFDWVYNWELACDCIKKTIAKANIAKEAIVGVSTTCMREGIVLYDKNGQEIWACANVDARSNDEVAELIAMNSQLEKECYLISGQTYALGALPRILWVKNKMPELYEKIDKVSMFNDWLIYKLTGVLKTEPSNGCTTGIFDLKKRTWDPSIMEKIGLKTDIFPEVAECGDIVGKVSQQGSTDTGLACDTPVVAGGGDAQLGCVGVGVTGPDKAAIFGGSFWQYEYNTTTPITDEKCRVRVNCHAVPNMWQYEAIAFQPGLVMRWYRDAFCQEEVARAKELGTDAYVLMNEQAEKVPAGSYGMGCTFSDVMNYIAWRHASPTFTNFELDAQKFNKFTFYRAIMENTAYINKGHLELVNEVAGCKPTEIIFASGASKSDLWCQILADVLEFPVKVPVVKEATALGAAILAGYGVGLYEDIHQTANRLVKWEKTYLPNKELATTYKQGYEYWRTLYNAQLKLAEQHITKPMWSAPGLA